MHVDMNSRRISSGVTPKAGSRMANLKKRVMKSFIFAYHNIMASKPPRLNLVTVNKDSCVMNTVLERRVLCVFSLLLHISACFLHVLEGVWVRALGLSLCTLS